MLYHLLSINLHSTCSVAKNAIKCLSVELRVENLKNVTESTNLNQVQKPIRTGIVQNQIQINFLIFGNTANKIIYHFFEKKWNKRQKACFLPLYSCSHFISKRTHQDQHLGLNPFHRIMNLNLPWKVPGKHMNNFTEKCHKPKSYRGE